MERNEVICIFLKLPWKNFSADILVVAGDSRDLSEFLTALIGDESLQVRVFLHICREARSIAIASNIMMWPLFRHRSRSHICDLDGLVRLDKPLVSAPPTSKKSLRLVCSTHTRWYETYELSTMRWWQDFVRGPQPSQDTPKNDLADMTAFLRSITINFESIQDQAIIKVSWIHAHEHHMNAPVIFDVNKIISSLRFGN